MSKLEDAAQKMIANLAEKTGKSLDEWIKIVHASGHTKHNAILKFLKSEHGFTHGYANMVSIRAREVAKGVSRDDKDLVANQYSGAKEKLRPIYEAILAAVNQFGDDVEVSPKKAYVSLRRSKQFAIVKPSTRTRVDVGLNMDAPTTDRLEASGSFNAMVSHRVRLTDAADVDDELVGWLRQAYEGA